jgi:hypothetical protein
MFEVIISRVKTGRVERRLFDSRTEADRYIEQRTAAWESHRFVRSSFRREHRVEVYLRDLPPVRTFQPADQNHEAAA